MKLNVGDYVRIKDVGIRKITDIETCIDGSKNYYIDETYVNRFNQEINCITKNCIIGQPSPNIIDLIEVGDYVNGYQVTSKDQFLGFGNHDWYMTNDEIKSIVTKEQFRGMQYVIK